MERPVQAKELCGRQTHRIRQRRDADRIQVGKPVSLLPGKAAIVYNVPVP